MTSLAISAEYLACGSNLDMLFRAGRECNHWTVIRNCKCLINRNQSQCFKIPGSSESLVEFFWIPRSQLWCLWLSTLEPQIYSQSPGLLATNSKRKCTQLQHAWCSQYGNKLVGWKSPTTPCTTGGNFSLGMGSMNQSKIPVGNKQCCLLHQDYKTMHCIPWDTFSREEFLWMQQVSLEGLNLKEGRVPKPHKVAK